MVDKVHSLWSQASPFHRHFSWNKVDWMPSTRSPIRPTSISSRRRRLLACPEDHTDWCLCSSKTRGPLPGGMHHLRWSNPKGNRCHKSMTGGPCFYRLAPERFPCQRSMLSHRVALTSWMASDAVFAPDVGVAHEPDARRTEASVLQGLNHRELLRSWSYQLEVLFHSVSPFSQRLKASAVVQNQTCGQSHAHIDFWVVIEAQLLKIVLLVLIAKDWRWRGQAFRPARKRCWGPKGCNHHNCF